MWQVGIYQNRYETNDFRVLVRGRKVYSLILRGLHIVKCKKFSPLPPKEETRFYDQIFILDNG